MMRYRNWAKSSIMGGLCLLTLAGCEGPGPEYQTPMPECVVKPKGAEQSFQEEIYREGKKPKAACMPFSSEDS